MNIYIYIYISIYAYIFIYSCAGAGGSSFRQKQLQASACTSPALLCKQLCDVATQLPVMGWNSWDRFLVLHLLSYDICLP